MLGERQGERLRVLESLRLPVPIGQEVFRSGTVSPGAAGQLVAVLERFGRTLSEYDIKDLQVVATTAVREARNRDVLLDSIRRKTRWDVTLLAAGDVVYYYDAYLFFRLSRELPVHQQTILTAELGAGSSDFSVVRRGAVLATVGLPLGMMRLTQFAARAGCEPRVAGDVLREYIATELAELRRRLPRIGVDSIVLFDENLVRAFSAMVRSPRGATGLFRLKRLQVEGFRRSCRDASPAELAATYRLAPDTADTLGALTATVSALLEVFERDEVFVVQTSLGEALLTYRLFDLGAAERYDKLKQQLSVARSLCYRHGADLKHARHVAFLSRRVFAGLAGRLGLEAGDLNYLLIAAHLHDIGKSVSAAAHHKHSEYLIDALTLFRLDAEEVRLIACTARYHRRSTPRDSHPLYMSLSPRNRMKVQKLAALLRVADALDRTHAGKVEDLRATATEADGIVLKARVVSEPVLERVSFEQKKDLLEDIAGCCVRLLVEREEP